MVDCKLDPGSVKRKPFSAFELFEYRVTFTIDYQNWTWIWPSSVTDMIAEKLI